MLTFKQYLVLLEDKIDFLKNQYRDKLSTEHDQFAQHQDSDAIIDHLSTASKKYLPWIIKQYQHGNIRQEDVPQIKDTLDLFDKHKRNLEKKDIGQYNNIGEIREAIKHHIGTAITRKEQEQYQKDANHELIHEEPGFKVYHTKNSIASQNIYGGGSKIGKTDWCTAARGMNNMFDSYNNDGNLYQIHAKNPDGTESLYQYHPVNGEFNDATDTAVEMSDFIKKHPEMKNVKAFKGSHPDLPLSHDELTQMIQDGTYTTDHLKHIKEDQIHLMPETLMKKIKDGTYGHQDLQHAKLNNYLSEDHLQELPNGLFKKIKFGTYNKGDLTHADRNGYLNKDHIEALKHSYMQKLKSNDPGINEIIMAKRYGYFTDKHGKQIQSNLNKWFRKHGDVDFFDTGSYVDALKKHNLFNEDHEKTIHDVIKKKFEEGRINADDYEQGSHYGIMPPEVEQYASFIDLIKNNELSQNCVDELSEDTKDTGIRYLLSLAHKHGYHVKDDVINSIANSTNSSNAHELLSQAHGERKYISPEALISIANNPNSTNAHSYIVEALRRTRKVPKEALLAIAKNPNSTKAHYWLATYADSDLNVPQDVIQELINNTTSNYVLKLLKK